MLDPRIYRTGMVFVLFALIVVAFSLRDQPGGSSTTLVPDAFNQSNAYATMRSLAGDSPQRLPGSVGDDAVATNVAARLTAYGYQVHESSALEKTPLGPRTLLTVTADRPGVGSGSGTIVIVAPRDASAAPSTSALSGTAVLLELARVLSGETQQHGIVLASISGSAGGVGARRLAASLGSSPDAVLVLGDLAARNARGPIVLPYSDGAAFAPSSLRATVAGALAAEGAPRARELGIGLQLAHLALPLASTVEAPFNDAAQPAVQISLAGARPAALDATLGGPDRIGAMGRAVLRAVDALDGAATIPGPSSYLIVRGKVLPTWAFRLLVLALLLPVLAVAIDGAARSSRRGYPVIPWVLALVARALPVAVGAAVLIVARAAGLLDATQGALAAGQGPATGRILLVLVLAVLLAVGMFAAVRMLVPLPRVRFRRARTLEDALDEPAVSWRNPGAATASLLLLTVVAALMWFQNPFAAALLIPALHLWAWACDPDLRPPRVARWALFCAGLVPPLLVVYALAAEAGLGPGATVWNGTLLVAGGGVRFSTLIEWCLLIAASAAAGAGALTAAPAPEVPSIGASVLGPAGHAGPGALGGTESALRR